MRITTARTFKHLTVVSPVAQYHNSIEIRYGSLLSLQVQEGTWPHIRFSHHQQIWDFHIQVAYKRIVTGNLYARLQYPVLQAMLRLLEALQLHNGTYPIDQIVCQISRCVVRHPRYADSKVNAVFAVMRDRHPDLKDYGKTMTEYADKFTILMREIEMGIWSFQMRDKVLTLVPNMYIGTPSVYIAAQ